MNLNKPDKTLNVQADTNKPDGKLEQSQLDEIQFDNHQTLPNPNCVSRGEFNRKFEIN